MPSASSPLSIATIVRFLFARLFLAAVAVAEAVVVVVAAAVVVAVVAVVVVAAVVPVMVSNQ